MGHLTVVKRVDKPKPTEVSSTSEWESIHKDLLMKCYFLEGSRSYICDKERLTEVAHVMPIGMIILLDRMHIILM